MPKKNEYDIFNELENKKEKEEEEEEGPHYFLLEEIGKGGYGVVNRAQEKSTSNIVAIKSLPLNSRSMPNTTIREIAILKELQHPNVIKMLNNFIFGSDMCLVLEYYDMNLKEYIKTTKRKGMTENHIKSFLHQIVSGLHYCHSHGIIHRDLKPHNILINKSGKVCITDFGLSRTFGIRVSPFTPRHTTTSYRAPEMLLSKENYSLPVDIWSLGCIFIECMLLQALFRNNTEVGQLISIFKIFGTPNETNWSGIEYLDYFNDSFPVWDGADLKQYVYEKNGYMMNNLALDLLQKMFKYDPRRRITAKKILYHSYFYDDSSMLITN